MKNIKLFGSIQLYFNKISFGFLLFAENGPFYLVENGITIKAKDSVLVGAQAMLNGITYTLVSDSLIQEIKGQGWSDNSFINDSCQIVTSLVRDMSYLFDYASSFNQDISSWDVSNVTNMSGLFRGAESFNQDISGWNTAAVTNMNYMFYDASSFNQDISSWDVSNVTNMSGLFMDASSFNQDISGWNTAAVTNMTEMFSGATAFNGNITGWNTAAVTNMNNMFQSATSFNQDISGWDVSNVMGMVNIYDGAILFNQDLSGWDISNVNYWANGVNYWVEGGGSWSHEMKNIFPKIFIDFQEKAHMAHKAYLDSDGYKSLIFSEHFIPLGFDSLFSKREDGLRDYILNNYDTISEKQPSQENYEFKSKYSKSQYNSWTQYFEAGISQTSTTSSVYSEGGEEIGDQNYEDSGMEEDIFQFPKIPTKMAKLLVSRFFPVATVLDGRPISYESFENAWHETKTNEEVIIYYQYPNYDDKPYEQLYQIVQGESNTIIKIINSYAIPM